MAATMSETQDPATEAAAPRWTSRHDRARPRQREAPWLRDERNPLGSRVYSAGFGSTVSACGRANRRIRKGRPCCRAGPSRTVLHRETEGPESGGPLVAQDRGRWPLPLRCRRDAHSSARTRRVCCAATCRPRPCTPPPFSHALAPTEITMHTPVPLSGLPLRKRPVGCSMAPETRRHMAKPAGASVSSGPSLQRISSSGRCSLQHCHTWS